MADRKKIEGLVIKYVAMAYGVDAAGLTAETRYDSLGSKSTRLIKISALLEDELDIKVPISRLMKNELVDDTVSAVYDLLVEAGR